MRHRAVYWGLAIAMMIVVSLFSIKPTTHVSAQNDTKTPNAELKALFDDDELFNQLSSGAQAALEAKFGRKLLRPDKEATSPRDSGGATSSRPGPLTALTQTLVNNPAADLTAQDTQSETAIVLGSGMNVVASFNDSGSFLGGFDSFTGVSRSTDMGATWTDLGRPPASAGGDAGDPVLARNKTTGRIYLATLEFNSLANMQVFRSDDDGATYLAPVNGTPGQGGQQDKEWITVDNFAGSGNGNVYMGWRQFGGANGMRFVRSTDHGATWSAALAIANGGQGAFVTVGSDHSVYYFWFAGANIQMRRSTDQGVTFAAPVIVTPLLSVGVNGDLGLGFRSNAFPHAAVNPANGHVYVVYNDNPAGADRGDVFFRRSTDLGATWSAAIRLNTDMGTADNWSPTLAVTPDGSALSVTWYDRRSDPANIQIQRWGVIGAISGTSITFGTNFRISDSFGVAFGQDPVVNTTYMGDYDMMDADNSFFYHVWGDNRLSNNFHSQQPDVRFAKYAITGPPPILDVVPPPAVAGGNGNGLIDPNECNDLTFTVMNNGGSTAMMVTGTLSTSTPEVTITTPNAAYPDIAAGGTGSNLTPFQISTSPSFVCGSTIQLTLTLNYTGGSDVSNLTLLTGSAGASTRFDSTDVPKTINDVTTNTSVINVAGFMGAIGKVTVSLQADHTFCADLDIALIAPDGTVIDLSSDNGSSNNDFGADCSPDASRTTFDDAAATAITAAPSTQPFAVGTFRPEQALSNLNGKSGAAVNGVWTLRIIDDLGGDVGVLNCWALNLAPLVCTDGGGQCNLEGCTLEITCPADTIAVAPTGAASGTVTYCPPIVGGTCTESTVVCTPPSGSIFPLGTTTVTCTASAVGAEDVSCSFTVTLFNACLEDDSNPNTVLIFNTVTGDYIFCCPNTSPNPITGKGKVKKVGSTFSLTNNTTQAPAHRLSATITGGSVNKGSAALQNQQGVTVCTIRDTNTLNNSCACAGLGGDCGDGGGQKQRVKK